jgi:3-oxoacyl-[acyl-carrier-protein] synthase-3
MHVHGLGHFHPDNVITNELLESLDIGTSNEWILERVGIRTRHTVLPLDYIKDTKNSDVRAAQEAALYTNAETGKRAADMALARAGLGAADIGLVVSGGCSPDECIPAASSRVAEALGIDVPGLDISAACASFCAQLHWLSSMRPERLPEYVLVVCAENSTRVVDYSDRASCVLWGDASIAAVVSPRTPGRFVVVDTSFDGDSSGADKVKVPRVGHFTQRGQSVQAFAVKRATSTFLELQNTWRARAPWSGPSDLALIGHQANLRMLEAVQRRCDIPDGLHLKNVETRGNTGAAGAPSVLSERWDDDTIPPAIAMAVVGSGLTWAGALLARTATLY